MSPETLDEYVSAGSLSAHLVPGTPQVRLLINPPEEILQLDISWDGEDPPQISDYVHIDTGRRLDKGQNWSFLRIRGTGFFREAYPLLCQVADLVQLESMIFSDAVRAALGSYHELLSTQDRLPLNEEIGLWGELLTLATLVDTIGADSALQAWRGGDDSDEHDFGLIDDDIEVKTTTSETRRHWIGSLTQLVPTGKRPLWLLSLQVTGAGAAKGMRLPDLIDLVAGKLPPKARKEYETRIAATKYSPSQPNETFRLLRLRNRPACYRVDDKFPRLTPETLTAAAVAENRIEEVSYMVRLDGLTPAAEPPQSIHSLTETGNTP